MMIDEEWKKSSSVPMIVHRRGWYMNLGWILEMLNTVGFICYSPLISLFPSFVKRSDCCGL